MTTLEKFVQLFNTANGTSLSAYELDIDKPVALPDAGATDNTTVTVHGKMQTGYIGDYTFTYHRINLPGLFGSIKVAVELPQGPATTRKLVESLNLQYGLAVPVEDVVDEPIVENAATIRISADSYEWVGELPVTINRVLTDVSSVLTDGNLDGFNYPTITPPQV